MVGDKSEKEVQPRDDTTGVVGTEAKGKSRFEAVDEGPGKYEGDVGVLLSLLEPSEAPEVPTGE